MNTSRTFASTLTLALLWATAGVVVAQQQPDQPGRQRQQTDQPDRDVQTRPQAGQTWNKPATRCERASDLLGKNAEGTGGERLGDVNDFIVDVNNGRVIYWTVDCNRKDCLVPVAVANLSPDGRRFQLSCTREQLEAQAIERDRWPDFADQSWSLQIHSHYNVDPYWQNPAVPDATQQRPGMTQATHFWFRPTTHWVKASDVIGMNVRNTQGEELGEINDLIVDPDSNRVVYGVLSSGGFLGIGDKLFAVPWSALETPQDHERSPIVLDVTKDRLTNAPSFTSTSWPKFADEGLALEIHRFYDSTPYWEESGTARDKRMTPEREEHPQKEHEEHPEGGGREP